MRGRRMNGEGDGRGEEEVNVYIYISIMYMYIMYKYNVYVYIYKYYIYIEDAEESRGDRNGTATRDISFGALAGRLRNSRHRRQRWNRIDPVRVHTPPPPPSPPLHITHCRRYYRHRRRPHTHSRPES